MYLVVSSRNGSQCKQTYDSCSMTLWKVRYLRLRPVDNSLSIGCLSSVGIKVGTEGGKGVKLRKGKGCTVIQGRTECSLGEFNTVVYVSPTE